VTQAVLADYRTAPIDENLRAMLALLEKLTLTPGAVTSADCDALRARGLSDAHIEDAFVVCAAFNIIDRIADALQFDVVSWEQFLRGGHMLLKRGYV
jgi:alkylhydroperoxidase family enzyme